MGSESSSSHFFSRRALKVLLTVLILAGAAWAYHRYGDALSLDHLAAKEGSLKSWKKDQPLGAAFAAFAVYVLVTGLSLPGAAALTLFFGWFFGFALALVLVSFASTAGATLAFLVSRFLLRDLVERKFGDRLRSFQGALEREGAFYLFSLRLIPAVPFFVINLVMGLTPLKTRTFWWVSQVGMLPGTAVYVYAGAQFPGLQKLADQGPSGIFSHQLILAFVLLGLFPIAVKRLMARFGPSDVAKEIED